MLSFRFSIFQKLIASFFVVALMPITLLGYFSYSKAKAVLSQQGIDNLQAIADDRALQVRSHIEDQIQKFENYSLSPKTAWMYEELIPTTERFQNLNEPFRVTYDRNQRILDSNARLLNYSSMMFVSPEGKIVFSLNDKSLENQNIYDSGFKARELARIFKASKAKNRGDLSSYYFDPTTNAYQIYYATPLENRENIDAFMIYQLNMNAIKDYTNNVSGLGKTGEILLLANQQDQIISTLRHPHKLQSAPSLGQVVNNNVDYRGEKILIAHSGIDLATLSLLVKQDQNETYMALSQFNSVLLIVLGLAVLIAASAATYLAKTIANPLVNLKQEVMKFEQLHELPHQEELVNHVVANSKDEVNSLKIAFNSMAHSLDIAMHNIQEQKKHLQHANQLQAEFCANMSHEIRTPMNGIIGMSELLLDEKLTLQQQDKLSVIQSSSHSLLSLINDILDLSKVEAGELSIEPHGFSLNDLVTEIKQTLSFELNNKNLSFEIEMKDDVPNFIFADRNRIRQCLMNYIYNAIKFTEVGGIKLKVSSLNNFLTTNGLGLKFEVIDTGMGIKEEHQPYIFNKFYQSNGSSSRGFGGTGLGTNITRNLASLMSGDVGLSSTEGVGSTFWFTVKIDAADQTIKDAPVENPFIDSPLLDYNILLVEDNNVNQMVAKGFLKKLGFCNIDVADDGEKAITACKNNVYDLIFMDCQMPVLDGYDASRKIRELPNDNASTKIIAITANNMQGDREKCLRAGMDDFLAKPFVLNSLAEVLNRQFTEVNSELV